jgi:hypothetical protein
MVAAISTGFIGVSVVSSSSAAAQRGFGCQLNPARCHNQLNTPKTFSSDRRKGNAKGKGRKKARNR